MLDELERSDPIQTLLGLSVHVREHVGLNDGKIAACARFDHFGAPIHAEDANVLFAQKLHELAATAREVHDVASAVEQRGVVRLPLSDLRPRSAEPFRESNVDERGRLGERLIASYSGRKDGAELIEAFAERLEGVSNPRDLRGGQLRIILFMPWRCRLPRVAPRHRGLPCRSASMASSPARLTRRLARRASITPSASGPEPTPSFDAARSATPSPVRSTRASRRSSAMTRASISSRKSPRFRMAVTMWRFSSACSLSARDSLSSGAPSPCCPAPAEGTASLYDLSLARRAAVSMFSRGSRNASSIGESPIPDWPRRPGATRSVQAADFWAIDRASAVQ